MPRRHGASVYVDTMREVHVRLICIRHKQKQMQTATRRVILKISFKVREVWGDSHVKIRQESLEGYAEMWILSHVDIEYNVILSSPVLDVFL